jgi:hypothetical protein
MSMLSKYRLQNNFAKTFELIDTCFKLKEAYLKQKYPEASQLEIDEMICKEIIARKERQWKLQKA